MRKGKQSRQARKKRLYATGAPLHIKQKQMRCHLSAELRKKYGTKSLQIRKGDKVKIVRGDNRGKTGKVSKAYLKLEKIEIEGIERIKKDGSKVPVKITPSNTIITEADISDKRRIKATKKKTEGT
jgi:large subunit ribosomal protein L24